MYMDNKLIWASFLQLSHNMWGDEGAAEGTSPYSDTMILHEPTWRAVIDYLPTQGINTLLIDLGDAIQYESHPEIAVKGAWSKDKMKQELDYIRSKGITPLPKLNFSTGHDTWLGIYQRMVSTPVYYQVCADLIKEVAELFGGPELFHLGMDEENAEMQAAYSFVCYRQHDLWWHDLYYLFDVCDKVGVRPWVWADMHWALKDTYIQKMPKCAMQSNWWYRSLAKNPDGTFVDSRVDAYHALEKAGFDQVPTSSTWATDTSMGETVRMAHADISPERLKGFMSCPWSGTKEQNLPKLLHDADTLGKAKRLFESLLIK